MPKTKKSLQQKEIEKEIEVILKQKDKLVAERLRMEIRNRIIERLMNGLSAELHECINRLIEAPPALTQEEIRLAQINRGKAIMMLRGRLPNIPMDVAREMIDNALNSMPRDDSEDQPS
jgi:hypothetical protein